MVSSQILIGGDGAETVIEGGGLRLVDRRTRTEIPLVVVQEARTDGGRHVEIVLTDSAVHRVDGGNPTAATAFVTALTAALPARRDPTGSARVTVTPLAPAEEPEEAEYHPKYRRRQVITLALLLVYVGYTIWVGVVRGAEVIIAPITAAIPLALGAGLLFLAVNVALVYFALKRRGITVPASFDFRTKDGAAWYKFTDADGVERSGRGKNRGPVTRVAYDPEDPRDYSFDLSGKSTLLRAGLLTLGALPLLGGGAALAVLPFLVD
ncbi:hypothetical protein MTF65_09315 [Streptomyces sp. APSN-46.1]|uniref:hypothetical protein n=1 Tax=Streptomyces sp. APSN-46.1 TaxID=2929049 RepID=UPI001FB4847D|nr:hypothetical protein [Streptomyces sp. APSN-46.1]MCJ1677529.1 hypothetical protein [Streptomyces sp. APSN-46.1]